MHGLWVSGVFIFMLCFLFWTNYGGYLFDGTGCPKVMWNVNLSYLEVFLIDYGMFKNIGDYQKICTIFVIFKS